MATTFMPAAKGSARTPLGPIFIFNTDLVLSTELMEELLIDPWDHLQLPDVVEVPMQLHVLVDEEGSLGTHTW